MSKAAIDQKQFIHSYGSAFGPGKVHKAGPVDAAAYERNPTVATHCGLKTVYGDAISQRDVNNHPDMLYRLCKKCFPSGEWD